jgi:hypothetical protein
MLAGCSKADTGPDKTALHYEGGATQAQKFKGCVNPSEKHWYGPGDHVYEYPTREVTYDASSDKGAESAPFKSVSADNAEMNVSVSVVMHLKTDCQTLRQFHEKWGKQYGAYYDNDDVSVGWVRLLNFGIGKPLDTELDRVVHGYDWRKLWNDAGTKALVEQAVSKDLQGLVDRQLQGTYFEDYSVLVQKPEPTNEKLKENTADEQAAVAKANSQLAQANADKAAAQAQIAVAQARAAALKAEVGALGTEAWEKKYAIDHQMNPFPPPVIAGQAAQK